MSDSENWKNTQAKLLEDIEQFSRSKLDLGAVEAQGKAKPQAAPPKAATAVAAAPQAAATTPPAAAPAPAAPPPGSLLEKLKREAQTKQMTESQRFSLQVQQARCISDALLDTFQYLREFCDQLNILKPAYPHSYNLLGIASLEGLAWQEGRADYRLVPEAKEDRLLDQVTLRYRLGSGGQLSIERENPAHETFQKTLTELNIPFKAEEVRNERGHVLRVVFSFPCEVKAGLAFAADYKAGDIRLLVRNILRFGAAEYRLPHEALSHEAHEELAKLIMGEESRFEKMFRRVA